MTQRTRPAGIAGTLAATRLCVECGHAAIRHRNGGTGACAALARVSPREVLEISPPNVELCHCIMFVSKG